MRFDSIASIRYAETAADMEFLGTHDSHASPSVLARKVQAQEVLVVELEGVLVGWLRFGLFWDSIPFMNLLYLLDGYRRQGLGTRLVAHWEAAMLEKGYSLAMTSTLSDEQAQHFYRALGYRDAGCLMLEGEALEIILTKRLG